MCSFLTMFVNKTFQNARVFIYFLAKKTGHKKEPPKHNKKEK